MRKRTLGASGHLRRGVLAATSVASVLSLTLGAAVAHGAAGDLDTSFGSGGTLVTSFTSSVDGANDMAIQADGKIVAVGYLDISGGFAVARYNTDGSLDTSTDSTPGTNFSGDGVAAVAGTASDGDFAEALGVAIQPGDQKIVVAGYAYNDDPLSNGSEDFALARFEPDGDLDSLFGGGDGTVVTRFTDTPDDFSHDNDRAEAVAVQGDGDIVAAGYGDPFFGGNVEDFAVARYNSNGVLDSGFGGDGRVTQTIFAGDSSDFGRALALLPGNKVLVVGSAQGTLGPGLALSQYEADGDPDPTFDGNGIRTRNFSGTVDGLYGVTVQGDGRIVTGGNVGDNFVVARWNVNGSDDNTFDENGYITTTFNSSTFNQVWNDIALHPDGTIVTAGITDDGLGADWAIGRFFSNGAVDRQFKPCSGASRTDFGDSDGAEGMAVDSGGRLVAAGYAGLNFGVARYLTTGPAVNCAEPGKKSAKKCKKKKKGKKGAAAAKKKKKKKCKKKKKKKK